MTVTLGSLGILSEMATFAKLALMLTFSWWFLRAFVRKDSWLFLLPFKSWTSLSLLALLVVTVLSLFNVANRQYAGTTLVRLITLYFAVLLIANVIKRDRRTLHWILVAFVIASIPSSLGGIYELVTHKQILKTRESGTEEYRELKATFGSGPQVELSGGEGGRRVVSFSGGSGHHAVHTVVYTAIAAMLPLLTRNPYVRFLAVFLVGINIINVVATASRTGVIGLGLAVLCFLYFVEMRPRHKWLIILFGILGGLLASLILDLPLARLLHKTSAAKGTVEFRVIQHQVALNMIEKNPILGVGPGNYIGEYHRYHARYPSHDKIAPAGPLHNAILRQFAEGGIVGGFFFLLVLAVVMLKLYWVRVRSPDAYLRLVAVAVLAGFVGWSGSLLFYPSFIDEQGWMLMGITIGLWNIHEKVLETSSVQRDPQGT